MAANQIIELLASRHWQDIFVSECKNGSSDGGHLRLDGWAMKKSWVHPLTIGYEVKVSRSDFVGDEKWRGYLQYCNEFYFVCPSGLIRPDELPDDTGLLWVAKTGTRLFRKKKPVYRTKTNLLDIYKYVLMCRTRIVHSAYYPERRNVAEWREWLAEKDEKKKLGYNVSRKIRELVATRIDKVEADRKWTAAENEKLTYFKDELKKLGFDRVPDHWKLDNKIKDLNRVLPEDFERSLNRIKTDIEKVLSTINSKDA
jgi:hypothetical protein